MKHLHRASVDDLQEAEDNMPHFLQCGVVLALEGNLSEDALCVLLFGHVCVLSALLNRLSQDAVTEAESCW